MNDSSSAIDVAIIGAGAAGLMAGICAARHNPSARIVILEGAAKLGAKILVAGGGRCNVTHDEVDETAYAGSSRNAIRKVLRRFDVPATIAFFSELGVELKREETGKLFPTTDSARTVLTALTTAAYQSGVTIQYPRRVEQIEQVERLETTTDPLSAGFRLSGAWGQLDARRIILATGGKSLPKSGSDGGGYVLAKKLGHDITERIFPALVPLLLPKDHFLCGLSGLTLPTTLELWAGSGKKITAFTNSTLCTHFGLSGPSVLDISRYYLSARADDQAATLTLNWLVDSTPEQVETELTSIGKTTPLRHFSRRLPERLVRALLTFAEIDPATPCDQLPREKRKALVQALTRLPLPISGDRGFTYAEVTAGGIPLADIRLETMESRRVSGLYFCGEICDVDGRIGGYNFQWAWSSGFIAGRSAVEFS